MCNPITTKEPPRSTKLPRLRSQALARAAQSGFPRLYQALLPSRVYTGDQREGPGYARLDVRYVIENESAV